MDTFPNPKSVTGSCAVFRQSYTRNGPSFLTKAWAMKVAYEGRRETFPLGTPNKAVAAASGNMMALSGRALIGAELGIILGVTDIDGSRPLSYRYTMGGPPELHRSLTD